MAGILNWQFSNVESLMKKLNIDLITHVLDWSEFKDIQLSFIKSSISNIEIPTDHAIWAILLRTASSMKKNSLHNCGQ